MYNTTKQLKKGKFLWENMNKKHIKWNLSLDYIKNIRLNWLPGTGKGLEREIPNCNYRVD